MPASPRRLLCVYQHAPTPGAPGIYRHRMLLAELVRRGWHVDMVSSPINYMRGEAPPEYSGRWRRREVIDGIHHHWVAASGDVHKSIRNRALNYATFAASATLAGGLLRRPDVIWASSPPLSIGTVGATLSRWFHRPWVYEVRDLWPESAASVGWVSEDSSAYRAAERLARRFASKADGVLVPTPGLVEPVRGHGAGHVQVVTGAIVDRPPDTDVRKQQRSQLGVADDTAVFLYVGAHGAANGLDMLLDAAKQTRELDVRFVMAGDGSDRARIEARIASEGIDNVTMLGPLQKADVGDLLMAADVCLHLLRPDPLFASALPTKVLEYFGAHHAFITTVPGLPQQLAEASGGAFAGSSDDLAAAVREWTAMSVDQRRERGEQSFRYGQEHYGLDATVDRLEQFLTDLVTRGR